MTSLRLLKSHRTPVVALVLITALLFGAAISAAQDDATDTPWSVYLSSFLDLQINQFNADGSTASYSVPAGTEGSLSGNTIAFAPDETRVAMCTTPPVTSDANAAPVIPITSLMVYDLAAESPVFNVELGEIHGCTVNSDSFSQDGSQVAVGMITDFPAGPETPQPESTWQLILVDAATGETAATLDALNPSLSALGFDSAQQTVMPYTRRVDGDRVYFALVDWFSEGQPSYDAFFWNTTDNTVEEAPLWGRPFTGDEVLTTDGFEFAYATLDENQPVANPGGPMYETNAVVVQREGSEPQIVYSNSEELIMSVRYVNDGAALAIGLLAGVDPSDNEAVPGQQPVRYILLTRDGAVTEIVAPIVNASIEVLPIPGGYITYTRVYDPATASQTSTLDAVTGDGSTNLWTDDGTSGSPWSLIHATTPDLSGTSLPVFVPATAS